MTRPDPQAFARSYVETLKGVLDALPLDDLARALDALEAAHAAGRQLLIAGNGGSAATASHMANDLVWGLVQQRLPGLKAIALGDGLPLVTAIANDRGYDEVFAVQVANLGRAGDVLLVITGSGNSPNVLRALEAAKGLGMTTVGFLGRGGGKALALVDVPVIVPSDDYGPIEDVHMVFDHLAIAYLRARLGAASR